MLREVIHDDLHASRTELGDFECAELALEPVRLGSVGSDSLRADVPALDDLAEPDIEQLAESGCAGEFAWDESESGSARGRGCHGLCRGRASRADAPNSLAVLRVRPRA